jgi:YHS domain-containing protein
MKVGTKVKTSLGEVFVLDIQERYLILFNPVKGEFIRANNYKLNNNKVSWGGGEYYFSLKELIENYS